MKLSEAPDAVFNMQNVLNKFYCWYNLSFSIYKMEFILSHLAACESIDLYSPLMIHLPQSWRHLDS